MRSLRVSKDFAHMVDGWQTNRGKKMAMVKNFQEHFGDPAEPGAAKITAASLYKITVEEIAKNCALLRDLHGDYHIYLNAIADLLMEDLFEAPGTAGKAVQ